MSFGYTYNVFQYYLCPCWEWFMVCRVDCPWASRPKCEWYETVIYWRHCSCVQVLTSGFTFNTIWKNRVNEIILYKQIGHFGPKQNITGTNTCFVIYQSKWSENVAYLHSNYRLDICCMHDVASLNCMICLISSVLKICRYLWRVNLSWSAPKTNPLFDSRHMEQRPFMRGL